MTPEDLQALERAKFVRYIGVNVSGASVYELTHAGRVLAQAGTGQWHGDEQLELFDPDGDW